MGELFLAFFELVTTFVASLLQLVLGLILLALIVTIGTAVLIAFAVGVIIALVIIFLEWVTEKPKPESPELTG